MKKKGKIKEPMPGCKSDCTKDVAVRERWEEVSSKEVCYAE